MGKAFFPLDEELGLLPGRLTPHAQECLVRFGAWMPFERAAKELAFVLKVTVSEPTARRYAESAGGAYEEHQAAEVTRLEQETPVSPEGLDKMFFSVDGAFIPLVGGEWAEVKTLTIGEIEAPVLEKEEWVVHSCDHSYFSRMIESDEFRRLALVETHRRGVEKSRVIAAATDGAEWEQGFIDFHCPNAIRILDFPHAAERVSQVGQALWGEETQTTKDWLTEQLHSLKYTGPTGLIDELGYLQIQHPTLQVLQTNLAYLEKRSEHMQYPAYRQQGLPIGSGAMESGNKVVVEARLKGAGMHWARPHVNPMLALRNILCSDRWNEAWTHIAAVLHQNEVKQRKILHKNRREALQRASNSQTASPILDNPTLSQPIYNLDEQTPAPPPAPESPKPKWSIPAPNHPWRRSPFGRAKYQSANSFSKN